MFEALFRIAALVESDGQGQRIFRVTGQGAPANERAFSSQVATMYQQEISRMLRAGDSLTITVRHDLPPRVSERTVRLREDQRFEGEDVPQPTPDLLPLIRTWYEPWMRQVDPGDVFTIAFRIQRP